MTDSVLQGSYILFVLAFLVTQITEFLFGKVFDKYLPDYKFAQYHLAVIIGSLVAWYTNLDLLYILSQLSGWMNVTTPGVVGFVMTGAVLGGGAKFVHDIMSIVMQKKIEVTNRNLVDSSIGQSWEVTK